MPEREKDMTKIDSLTIKPLASGFLLDIHFEETDDLREHAYSDFEDLINGLTLLLGPNDPRTIIHQMLKDTNCTLVEEDGGFRIVAGGTVEPLDPDDGWREWDGQLKPGQEYPPGVKHDSQMQFRLRQADIQHGPVQANSIRWFWGGNSGYDPDSDVIAYRVVKS